MHYISPITTLEVRRTRGRFLVEQTNYDNILAAKISNTNLKNIQEN